MENFEFIIGHHTFFKAQKCILIIKSTSIAHVFKQINFICKIEHISKWQK